MPPGPTTPVPDQGVLPACMLTPMSLYPMLTISQLPPNRCSAALNSCTASGRMLPCFWPTVRACLHRTRRCAGRLRCRRARLGGRTATSWRRAASARMTARRCASWTTRSSPTWRCARARRAPEQQPELRTPVVGGAFAGQMHAVRSCACRVATEHAASGRSACSALLMCLISWQRLRCMRRCTTSGTCCLTAGRLCWASWPSKPWSLCRSAPAALCSACTARACFGPAQLPLCCLVPASD